MYVLKLPKPLKFEAVAYDGLYLESLPHGTFRVLIRENRTYRITEFRHMTFAETRFPFTHGLDEPTDEEIEDSDYKDEDISGSSDEDEDGTYMSAEIISGEGMR